MKRRNQTGAANGSRRSGLAIAILSLGQVLAACAHLGGLPDGVAGQITSEAEDPFRAPAISTAYSDTEGPITLGDDAPQRFRNLLDAPRTASGSFLLSPGSYELRLRSYCLHAGTHGPSSGDGYLFAPLKGSRAGAIRSILRNSAMHPEIAQSRVQTLIWAIETFSPINKLPADLVMVADALLSAEEISHLNHDPSELFTGPLLDEALARAPPALREIYAAQAALRAQLIEGQHTFEELEAIAVLAGAAPNDAANPIRKGQWSKHGGGLYARYIPESYSITTVQIFVPHLSTTKVGRDSVPVDTLYSEAPMAGPRSGLAPPGAAGAVDPIEYDVTNDVATPAETGSQRLGLSAVSADEPDGTKDLCRTRVISVPSSKETIVLKSGAGVEQGIIFLKNVGSCTVVISGLDAHGSVTTHANLGRGGEIPQFRVPGGTVRIVVVAGDGCSDSGMLSYDPCAGII